MNNVKAIIKKGYNYLRIRLPFFLPAKWHLKILYKRRIGKKLNLKNPVTFNEKMQWLKLYDHNPLYSKLVDKFEVKKYVADKIGKKYIIPTFDVYDDFDDIDFDKLPNQFVIKCTHDSGGVVICKDKKKFDLIDARNLINKKLNSKYYYHGREWPYKNVRPRIIIEKYMADSKTEELVDYKVMCFNGEPKIIFTCTDRFSDGLKVTFFDFNWNKLPFERHYSASKKKISKPKKLKEMLELSKTLAKDIPFVRMDWYEINGNLYFGEYTFYPGSGLEEFTPEVWDKKLGDYIELPKKR